MLKKVLTEIYTRDLNRLLHEVKLYEDESKLWITKAGISNSAGNLVLHLIGNLNHFIGARLGNSGYIRNRPDEFALKNIPKEDLIKAIESTATIVLNTLATLNEADFNNDFPEEVFGKKDTVGFILVHLTTHLTYHLGQINYHRRLIG
jgi:uncharacterized damage-inducible protein DinB